MLFGCISIPKGAAWRPHLLASFGASSVAAFTAFPASAGAFDPRKTPEGIEEREILIIVLFWVGIGECVERE